jgi:hypothetical protein
MPNRVAAHAHHRRQLELARQLGALAEVPFTDEPAQRVRELRVQRRSTGRLETDAPDQRIHAPCFQYRRTCHAHRA